MIEAITSRRRPLVAPSAGAWIEMYKGVASYSDLGVAPSAGAWIEIYMVK